MALILVLSILFTFAELTTDFEGVETKDYPVNISGSESAQPLTTPTTTTTTVTNQGVQSRVGSQAEEEQSSEEVNLASGGFRSRLDKIWKSCSPQCKMYNPWIPGDAAHCKRKSCHNTRQAADIHTIICNGRTYKEGRSGFKSRMTVIASCLKGKPNTTVLWQVKNHYSHIHFNFKGCSKKKCSRYTLTDEESGQCYIN